MIEDYFDEEFTPLLETKTGDNAGGSKSTFTELAAKKFWGKIFPISNSSYVQDLAKQYSRQSAILASVDVEVSRGQFVRSSTSGEDYEILDVDTYPNHHVELKVGY